jgi:tetratricopeptide (TPR) repeat protein
MQAARSGYPTPGREAWPPASDAKLANAKDLEMPGILPETHFAAARLFESQGLFAKAIHQYRKTIAVQHHHTEAYHRLGLLLSLTGQREEALKALTRAVELKPDDAILRNNLGFELMLSRRWADAERELSHAIRLRPDFPRAYINQGIVQSKLGRFNEALVSFRTALPEADAYYNLGLMYRGQQQYPEAAGAFRHVLALNPDFVAARTQLEQIVADQALQTPLDGDIRTADARTRTKRGDAALSTTKAKTPAVTAGSEVTWDQTLATVDDMMTRSSDAAPSRAAAGPRTGIKPTSIQLTTLDESKRSRRSTQTAPQKARGDDAPTAEELAEIITILESELARAERQLTQELDTESAEDVDTSSTTTRRRDRASAHAYSPRREPAEPVDAIDESWADGPVSLAYLEEPVSYLEVEARICDPEWDGWITPGDRIEVAACPAEPALRTEPRIETIACIDSWALLRELEEQLSILRNEIECLESSEAGSSGMMTWVQPRDRLPRIPVPLEWRVEIEDLMMGPPAPGEYGRWTDARLVVDVINQQRAKGEKQPIRRESLLNIGAPIEELEAEIDADSKDQKPGKTTTPARRPLSWRGTLDRLEELLTGTPNEPAVCTSERVADRQAAHMRPSTERHAGLHRVLEHPTVPRPR